MCSQREKRLPLCGAASQADHRRGPGLAAPRSKGRALRRSCPRPVEFDPPPLLVRAAGTEPNQAALSILWPPPQQPGAESVATRGVEGGRGFPAVLASGRPPLSGEQQGSPYGAVVCVHDEAEANRSAPRPAEVRRPNGNLYHGPWHIFPKQAARTWSLRQSQGLLSHPVAPRGSPQGFLSPETLACVLVHSPARGSRPPPPRAGANKGRRVCASWSGSVCGSWQEGAATRLCLWACENMLEARKR